MRNQKAIAIQIATVLLLVFSCTSFAATLSVTSLNDNGVGTLRQAVTDAQPNDTIYMDIPGKIVLTSGHISLLKNVHITGTGACDISVSGNYNSRIFDIPSGITVTIDGITIEEGRLTGDWVCGPAIQNYGALTLLNSIITNCKNDHWAGGGIYLNDYDPANTLTIDNCIFSYDSSGSGAAISTREWFDGTITVSNTTFEHCNTNPIDLWGNTTGTLDLENCTFSNNRKGALMFDGIVVTATNCTFNANTGSTMSASIFMQANYSPTMFYAKNCLFSDSADNFRLYGGTIPGWQELISLGNNISNDSSTIDYLTDTSDQHYIVDPMLAPLADNGGFGRTHELLPGSPAIDPFSSNGAPTFDQRGYPRLNTADVGSFELSSVGPFQATVSNVTMTSSAGANDGSITLDVTGGTPPYTYTWNPPVSSTNQAINLSSGTYQITVADPGICSSIDTVLSVIIIAPDTLTAQLTGITTTGCNLASATVTPIGGSGPYAYSWSPSGGTDSIATALAPGNYTVTIFDSSNDSAFVNVTIDPSINVTAEVQDTSMITCNGLNDGSATINPLTGISPFTYSWSTSPATTPSVTAMIPGLHQVTVTDAIGCETTLSVTITEPQSLQPAVIGSINPTCNASGNGEITVACNGGSGMLSYSWDDDLSQVSATALNLGAGSYTVTITDANNCTTSLAVVLTEPFPMSVSLVNSLPPQCYGDSTGFIAISSSGGNGIYSYAWTPTAPNSNAISNLPAGSYCVEISDGNNCKSNMCVTITEPAEQSYQMIGDSIICAGEAIDLAVSNGQSYIWSSGDNTSSVTLSPTSNSTVWATIMNTCDTITLSKNIIVNPLPNPFAGNDTTITPGSAITLQGTGGISYEWSYDPSITCTNCQFPVATPTETTSYYLTVESAEGCKDFDTVTIAVDHSQTIFIPNIFSPNGDGNNDKFSIHGLGIKSFELVIFDRWGGKIFTSNNMEMQWDGTYDGVALNSEVFTYNLETTYFDDKLDVHNGTITLIR